MGTWLTILVTLGLLGWILWTMPIGQRIALRLGMRGFHKEGAPQEDRDFLLNACGGDRDRVQQSLAQARDGQPEMNDAQAYRRAIRTYMRHKHGGKVVGED
jgi:hypothetical protein